MIFLLYLFLFHIITNQVWFTLHTAPPTWDAAENILFSVRYFQSLIERGIPGFLESLLHGNPYRAPLNYALPSLVYGVVGKGNLSFETALFLHIPFGFIILFFTYKIGEKLYNPKAGKLACFFLSTYPLIFGLSRVYLDEFMLTGWTILCVYYLLQTDGFLIRKSCVKLSLCLAAGLLTKTTFPAFVVFPIMLTIFQTFRSPPKDTKRILLNLSIVLVTTLLIVLPWYVTNWSALRQFFTFYSVEEGAVAFKGGHFPPNFQHHLSFTSQMQYVADIFSFALSPFYSFVFLVGVTILLVRRLPFKSWFHLMNFIVVGFLPFTLIGHQQIIQHIAPLLPFVAILSGYGMSQIKAKWFLALLIIFGLTQTLYLSFGNSKYPQNLFFGDRKYPQKKVVHFLGVNWHWFWRNRSIYDGFITTVPLQEKWPYQEILKAIKEDYQKRASQENRLKFVPVGIIANTAVFNKSTIELSAILNRIPIQVVPIGLSEESKLLDYQVELESVSYVIYKTGWQGLPAHTRYADSANTFLLSSSSFQKLDETFLLPDGSQAVIFIQIPIRVNGDPTPQFSTLVNFGNKMILLGYDLSIEEVTYKRRCKFHFYWRCESSLDKDYVFFIHVTDQNGKIVNQLDYNPNHGIYPTSLWKQGEIFVETKFLEVLKTEKPLWIKIGMYDTQMARFIDL